MPMKWKNARLLGAVSVLAAAVPLAPASAATQVTFVGYFEDHRLTGEYPDEYDFAYSYYYDEEDIVHYCVEEYDAYCDWETVPLVAASGRIGNTSIPFHQISGTARGYYDDPVGFSFRPTGETLPYIAGTFIDYEWHLRAPPLAVGADSGNFDDLQVYSAGGANPQRVYIDGVYTDQVILPAVPEPATWLMLLAGFGAIGTVLRRSRRQNVTVSYA